MSTEGCGPSPKEILRKYTSLTGLPTMPPTWSFGLWLSTSFTTSYDEQTVSGFIDGMIERDLPLSVFHFDGSDPERMHNYYAYLYNKTVFEVLRKRRGDGDAVVFARAATAGSQQFPIHWGGDCESTYEAMAESLRGGLRGSRSYRVPWLFDEEAVDVLRVFAKLKGRLMPYLHHAARQAATEGTPTTLEFPDDPACTHLERQYAFSGRGMVRNHGSGTTIVVGVPEASGTFADAARQVVQEHGDAKVRYWNYADPALDRLGCDWHFSQHDHRSLNDYIAKLELVW